MGIALGIDLGTSKVACVLVDIEHKQILGVAANKTDAAIPTKPGCAEQDVSKILSALEECLKRFEANYLQRISVIGVTGQMHGVLLWKSSGNGRCEELGNLITWQDERCNQADFLSALRAKCGHANLSSGFGCATLAWLAQHEPRTLARFDRSATVHDYLVWMLCGSDTVLTDSTDAASWGAFRLEENCWDKQALSALEIPCDLMPQVVVCGTQAGAVTAEPSARFGLPAGIPVITAIGDNQASLYATIDDPQTDLALTLGTGGQLSVVVERSALDKAPAQPGFEYRPYVNGSYIAVAASLCGGSAFRWLAESIVNWCRELEIANPDLDEVYRKLDTLAMEDSELKVCSSFLGERHAPLRRGSISNIDLENFTLRNLSAALTTDILENLRDMLPHELWRTRKRIVGSGNGIRKHRSIQTKVQKLFGLPLHICEEREEAAYGAALFAANSLTNS